MVYILDIYFILLSSYTFVFRIYTLFFCLDSYYFTCFNGISRRLSAFYNTCGINAVPLMLISQQAGYWQQQGKSLPKPTTTMQQNTNNKHLQTQPHIKQIQEDIVVYICIQGNTHFAF